MLTIAANGRLTREVELRATPSGKSVATVSVPATAGTAAPTRSTSP
jgi:single-stranded DNA-binding protein